jgi:hypothetical protein
VSEQGAVTNGNIHANGKGIAALTGTGGALSAALIYVGVQLADVKAACESLKSQGADLSARVTKIEERLDSRLIALDDRVRKVELEIASRSAK